MGDKTETRPSTHIYIPEKVADSSEISEFYVSINGERVELDPETLRPGWNDVTFNIGAEINVGEEDEPADTE